MQPSYCLFCDKDNTKENRIITENDLFYARWDNFPAAKGHAEVLPKKHIVSFFDLAPEAVLQMYQLIKETKAIIAEQYNPDGYNVGVNEGEAAGRSVHHLHVHIIPRYLGDVEDASGGIRSVIPGKGKH